MIASAEYMTDLDVTFWNMTQTVAALIANFASFGLLWAYRKGDANMRSAWICTRNDVLGILRCCSPRSVCLVRALDGLTS